MALEDLRPLALMRVYMPKGAVFSSEASARPFESIAFTIAGNRVTVRLHPENIVQTGQRKQTASIQHVLFKMTVRTDRELQKH